MFLVELKLCHLSVGRVDRTAVCVHDSSVPGCIERLFGRALRIW